MKDKLGGAMEIKDRLEAAVRLAANGWIEQTETDRAVLRALQAGTVAVCAEFLLERGYERPSAVLRAATSDEPSLRLDLGCGQAKQEGFVGVDQWAGEGVDIVHDLRTTFPWPNSSVDEVYCNQVLEHLEGPERVHFLNEVCRVLKPWARATVIVPDWKSRRSVQDWTHKFPPLCERAFSYVRADERREMKVDHYGGWTCDFDYQWRYLDNGDLCVTLTKR